MALTQVSPGLLDQYASPTAFKNRVINGHPVVDQRNAGAAVSVSTGNQTWSVDRWWGQGTAASGVFTMQQSSTAPAGFSKSLAITVTTADSSLAATDLYDISHRIEGFNIADFSWGTAGASPVNLSFWARSNLTGTHGGAITNASGARSYPFTYTINAANTWEFKSIPIPGDTSGTWATDNTMGLGFYFGLGCGSTYSGTAGAWAGAFYITATGAQNLMATVGNNLYITGVQLEKGSTATSFDYRPYGTELALCQRYCFVISGVSAGDRIGIGVTGAANNGYLYVSFPTVMRAPPSLDSISSNTWNNGVSAYTAASNNIIGSTTAGLEFYANISGASAQIPFQVYFAGTNGKVIMSAEL